MSLGAQKAARAVALRVELLAAIEAEMARPLIDAGLVTASERASIASRVKTHSRSATGIGSVRGKMRRGAGPGLSLWEVMT